MRVGEAMCGRGDYWGGDWRTVTHRAAGLATWVAGWMVHLPKPPKAASKSATHSL